MGKRFGREIRHSDVSQARMSPFEFQVESYLRYQGEKFAQSFNANCYILFTKILDMFDFSGEKNNDPVAAFKPAKCDFLVISFTSDWRFPVQGS